MTLCAHIFLDTWLLLSLEVYFSTFSTHFFIIFLEFRKVTSTRNDSPELFFSSNEYHYESPRRKRTFRMFCLRQSIESTWKYSLLFMKMKKCFVENSRKYASGQQKEEHLINWMTMQSSNNQFHLFLIGFAHPWRASGKIRDSSNEMKKAK